MGFGGARDREFWQLAHRIIDSFDRRAIFPGCEGLCNSAPCSSVAATTIDLRCGDDGAAYLLLPTSSPAACVLRKRRGVEREQVCGRGAVPTLLLLREDLC